MKTPETQMFQPAHETQANGTQSNAPRPPDYEPAEAQFETLLSTDALDENLSALRPILSDFEQTLNHALTAAYQNLPVSEAAHCFLQRILYRINRLRLFWYDDLQHYKNERSVYLQSVCHRIEKSWQSWELKALDIPTLKKVDVKDTLQRDVAMDLKAEPSEAGLFFSEHVGEAGYRRLLEITSLDGLVEASQLSRILGGVSNEIHCTLTRLFLEEYGGGRPARKHSTFFETMLREFGMQTEPEAYFDRVPWEVLAGINHSFLLSDRKLYYLRYIGGLLYTEVSVPSAFCHYSSAARRLDLPQSSMGYWDLHIKEDERHGRWMLNDVALPLAARYPDDAWELLFGYNQQRLISRRSGEAIARSARQADLEADLNE